jgi:hypothetical protein
VPCMMRSAGDHGRGMAVEKVSSSVIWRWHDSGGRQRGRKGAPVVPTRPGDSQGCTTTQTMRWEGLSDRAHRRGKFGGGAALVSGGSGGREATV